MARLPRRVCSLTTSFQAVGTTLALLLLGGAGCTGQRYTIRTLPAEYLASHTENVGEIGLANLQVPPANSQLIGVGDVLEVTIVTNFGSLTTATTPARVEKDGAANIALIGRVALVGLELDEAEAVIAAEGRARGVFRNPHVVVEMKRQYVNKITVLGAVEAQGVVELPHNCSSLLGALVEAGGLSEDAGPEVVIRRPLARGGVPNPLQPPGQRVAVGERAELASYEVGPSGGAGRVQIMRVNLTQAAVGGDGGGRLEDGDVVIVGKRVPKPIYVIGLVNKPGEYELPPNQDTRMLDALAMAGERTMQVADRVIVIRRVPGEEEPVVVQLSVREAKANGAANLLLAPGDTVSVEETPVTVVVRAVTDVIRIGIGGSIGFF